MIKNILYYFSLLIPRLRPEWSIGIYEGTSPLSLGCSAVGCANPVLTPDKIRPIKSTGVADPFLIHKDDTWFLFFEIENSSTGRGEIGVAKSKSLKDWEFQGGVLKEDFHLSYPLVFFHEGEYYMLPEAARSGKVIIYKAHDFPFNWQVYSIVDEGRISDPTIFFYDNRWWIIALKNFLTDDAMVIYYADSLDGPWREHDNNPIYKNKPEFARCAGRVIKTQYGLIRFSQNYKNYYGQSVNAFRIKELTPHSFCETQVFDDFYLKGHGRGWSSDGVHHLDVHELSPGEWVASVDGCKRVMHIPAVDRLRAWLYRICE